MGTFSEPDAPEIMSSKGSNFDMGKTAEGSTEPSLICPQCEKPVTEFVEFSDGTRQPKACSTCISQAERDFKARRDEAEFCAMVTEGLVHREMWDHRFELSQLDNEDANAEAWAHGRLYAEELGASKRNLFIHGEPGVGKTWLAECILCAAISQGYWVATVPATTLIDEALDFAKTAITHGRAMAPILLIDDLDKMKRTERTLSKLWEVLDIRSTKRRRTIVTANMEKASLYQFLCGGVPENKSTVTAALDRLNPCQTIAMTGGSQRERFDG